MTMQEELRALRAELEANKLALAAAQASGNGKSITFSIGPKGGVQINYAGQFPFTPYMEQVEKLWGKLEDATDLGIGPALKAHCLKYREFYGTKVSPKKYDDEQLKTVRAQMKAGK